MANEVFNKEEITLSDGTSVLLKPNVIKKQRKFMHEWEKMADVEDADATFNVYINCSAVCLSNALKETIPNQYNGEYELTDEYRDYLEDTLELDTIFKVLDVCGGLKLNDPKLLEAVEQAVQDGPSSTS